MKETTLEFKSIIHQYPKPLVITDSHFKVLYANLYFEQIILLDHSSLVINQSTQMLNFEFCARLTDSLAQGEPAYTIKLADQYYKVQLIAVPDHHFYFMVFDNITKITQLESQFNHQNLIMQTIVDAIPQYVFWKNEHSVFEGCNSNFAQSASFMNVNQVIGLTDYHMPWKESADKYIKDDQLVINGHKPLLGYDEWQRSLDGTHKVMQVNKIPVFSKDKTSVVCLYIDNTENYKLKKNIEEANLARNLSEKVMSDFILNMQHDIRTPLAGIVGLGDVVLSMKANEITEIHSAVKDIVNSARRLLTYCESMVDLHKIQEAVNQSEPEAISIGELIQSIYEIEKPAADTKGIKLTYQLDPKDIHCIVNKNKLERVLVNLISNAIKFTEAGSVEIHVNLVRKNNERDALLRFMINDTGIGIHEDDLDYVFQQFSKLKPSYRDTKGLNLGFGLRLAKMFVNDLGGDLSLQSEVGKGSSFLVDIPVLLPLAYLYDLVNEC